MVLRIVFSGADLGRVRVAAAHPTWELVLAINSMQSPVLPAEYRSWRTRMRALGRTGRARRLPLAAALARPGGSFPDFLTPQIDEGDVGDVNAHYATMLSLPKAGLRADLARTFRRAPAPPWARRLHEHGRLDGLVGVLRDCHAIAVGPVWREVHRRVEADRAVRARQLVEHGVDHLLSTLHPSIRWRNPVLEADYPVDRTIDLGGRGLTVLPAHFCWGAPVTLLDPERPPTLVYPALKEDVLSVRSGRNPADPTDPAGPDGKALGKLLGATRARLLAELAVAGSTTRLAARLDVSQAAVSQHTGVLRNAGLLTTSRVGQAVQHSLTPLGRELLRGGWSPSRYPVRWP
ncbi:ArsR/SmtB family transcription factor [Amycolatopsis nigrescens]|uniref:ArsR/SmtB family transcription factor n=1 Tax=Amycolatopsis nigrescens TaxID=381445 RepID=UPI0003625AE4|nr:helix-turn-helix domain-containing protein [Amycolatopsis nigrescens]